MPSGQTTFVSLGLSVAVADMQLHISDQPFALICSAEHLGKVTTTGRNRPILLKKSTSEKAVFRQLKITQY